MYHILPHAHIAIRNKKLQYLLLSHVRARQIWFILLQQVGLQALTPQPGVVSFSSWWCGALKRIYKLFTKRFNSPVKNL